jgi:hypothetical protein
MSEVASHDQPPDPSRRASTLLKVITVLLLIQTLLNAIQFANTYQQQQLAERRAASHAERVAAAEALVLQQRDAIASLTTSYQKAAYNNPALDRIAEQQLVATEWLLVALQVIATQNSQLIQLLAAAP